MSAAAWIRVNPKEGRRLARETVRGIDFVVQISPYDLPEAFRGCYVQEKGAFRIEFKYLDDEKPIRKQASDLVTLEVGIFSKKLLAIEVEVDRHDLHVVRLEIGQIERAVERAGAAVQTLRRKIGRPNAQLNYSAIAKILNDNKSNPRLVAT